MSLPAAEPTRPPLSPRERRVLGVLVEKQKTTPEYYPMTVAAIVSGCNQKSNRDPVVNYDVDAVEETLQGLRKKGATALIEGSGRVVRWKHQLYEWLDLKDRPAEMAVMAELLLRGPQTEGDLRSRAGRMTPLPDMPALQKVLESLTSRGLAIYLSPPGQRRGVVVTHGLYPPDELERIRQAQARAPVAVDDDDEPRPARQAVAPAAMEEVAALRAEVQSLRETVEALAAEVRALKNALGA
jgi:uncharacterized protein YceH (UPF0502 family)